MNTKQELTHKEVASNGGKKRWAGKTKEERKEIMSKVWGKRVKKVMHTLPVDSSSTVG